MVKDPYNDHQIYIPVYLFIIKHLVSYVAHKLQLLSVPGFQCADQLVHHVRSVLNGVVHQGAHDYA